jgi:hypothetical protein
MAPDQSKNILLLTSLRGASTFAQKMRFMNRWMIWPRQGLAIVKVSSELPEILLFRQNYMPLRGQDSGRFDETSFRGSLVESSLTR